MSRWNIILCLTLAAVYIASLLFFLVLFALSPFILQSLCARLWGKAVAWQLFIYARCVRPYRAHIGHIQIYPSARAQERENITGTISKSILYFILLPLSIRPSAFVFSLSLSFCVCDAFPARAEIINDHREWRAPKVSVRARAPVTMIEFARAPLSRLQTMKIINCARAQLFFLLFLYNIYIVWCNN